MRQGLGEMCPTNLLIVSISCGTDVCLKLVCVKFYGLERAAALDKSVGNLQYCQILAQIDVENIGQTP